MDLILQAPTYEMLMTLVTFLVLYADDLRILAFDKQGDPQYYYFMLSCFFIFATEIITLSIIRPGYIFGFFFWMDLLSTMSTVMEIPLVMNDLLGIDFFSQQKSAKLAKAGRASRVSSKATKVIRVIRLIRLVRIAKLYKYAYKSLEGKLATAFEKNQKQNENELQPIQNTIEIETKNEEAYLANQKLIQFNNRMIPTTSSNNQNEKLLKYVSQSTQREATKLNYRFDIEANKGLIQLIEFTDKPPIRYAEQKNHSFDKEFEYQDEEDSNCTEQKDKTIKIEPILFKSTHETKVGKTLSDLTTKRAIMVMFSVMISIPLLDYNTFFQDVSAYETGLNLLESSFENQKSIDVSYKIYNQTLNSNYYPIFILQIDTLTLLENENYLVFREEEIKQLFSTSGLSKILIGNKEETNLNSILGIIRTSFVIIVLVAGAVMFSKDANDLVVAPIESMLIKVKRISNNPLEAARIEEDLAIYEEYLKSEKMDKKLKKSKQQEQTFETIVLERLIVKTGALLAIGFGEAGTEIIGANMKKAGAVNPLIPGKKIFSIFGFCDIRMFSDITEILEEKVMLFVNEIAEIVHATVNCYEGAINKNIGEAFLMVWKFPEHVAVMNKEKPNILNLKMANNYADFALLSLIKIFIKVQKSKNIQNYAQLPQIQQRLPNYKITMGFGLHIGWAIEGAIGSQFKIDASYLSPNVNMASRLEAATRQYGIFHLVSGPIYQLLSNECQQFMRQVDRITVKGSIQPIGEQIVFIKYIYQIFFHMILILMCSQRNKSKLSHQKKQIGKQKNTTKG